LLAIIVAIIAADYYSTIACLFSSN